MTSLLRAISQCARVSTLACSSFISLALASLARRRRESRPRLRPSRSRYAYSGFRRFACLLMIVVMFLQVTLFPPEVSQAAVKAVSATAINYGQGAHFWWHSSGWAARAERLRNKYLPNIGAQAQPKGWDGKGAPRRSRPAPPEVETQQDRDGKIARIKIFPGDVEIKTGPAAPKIQAAWGAANYKHGGLMQGIEHIMYRHGPNSGFKNVSRFANGTMARDIQGYVDQAIRYGNVTPTAPNAFTIEYNLGRVIGTNISGSLSSSIRIYVRDGIIQTAFPF